MAQIITNYAAKKLLGSQLEKYKHKAVGGDDDVRPPSSSPISRSLLSTAFDSLPPCTHH